MIELAQDTVTVEPEHAETVRRATALWTMLIWSIILLAAFVAGAFLLLRVRRWFLRPPESRPTEYVDAWSRARVTDEEIERATADDADDATDHRFE